MQHGPSVKYARCFLSKLIKKVSDGQWLPGPGHVGGHRAPELCQAPAAPPPCPLVVLKLWARASLQGLLVGYNWRTWSESTGARPGLSAAASPSYQTSLPLNERCLLLPHPTSHTPLLEVCSHSSFPASSLFSRWGCWPRILPNSARCLWRTDPDLLHGALDSHGAQQQASVSQPLKLAAAHQAQHRCDPCFCTTLAPGLSTPVPL